MRIMRLQFIKRGLSSLSVVVLIGFSSGGVVIAETCTPSQSNGNGVAQPTGAAAHTFIYNCDTNLWENDHFTYSPVTRQTTPKDPVVYIYNNDTGKWDTDTWVFNAPSGKYVKRTNSVSQPPVGATKVGGPVGGPAPRQSSGANTGMGSVGASGLATSGSGSSVVDSNGAAVNAVSMANGVSATATTGDSSVTANTSAGNATTGDAKASVLVVNSLQSNTTICGDGNTLFFVTDIDGDVNGDILLDPATLQAAAAALAGANRATYNTSLDAEMNNYIDVAAQSGNASVSQNTAAGSATSGNATAMANIINLINSAITAGSSFTGVININGNLNGDILLPPDFIDQLIASNVPTIQVNPEELARNNSAAASVMTDQSVRNNITANAASGQANVTSNTAAGNANSGSSRSNVTVFNLTGSTMIGSNSLLVFVNNMGRWVGLLVDAPGSASAAQYGDEITTNTFTPHDTGVDNTTNSRINNDINVSAQSGDSMVDRNTKAGDAKTGDAKTAVNVLNVSQSTFTLSNWLGILFINVFGTWNGSFGVNTAAGDPVVSQQQGATVQSGAGSGQTLIFAPREQTKGRRIVSIDRRSISSPDAQSTESSSERVEAAFTYVPNDDGPTELGAASTDGSMMNLSSLLPVGAISFGLGAAILVSERLSDRRKQKRAA